MEGYQYNPEGKVAVKHYNSNPCTVRLNSGRTYSFVPKVCVSMAWVEEEDVPFLLATLAPICCGMKAQKFFLANALDVCLWMTGERC